MKPRSRVILTFILPFMAVGPKECDCVGDFVVSLAWVANWPGRPSSSGFHTSVMNAVAVGDSGRILSTSGRPPFSWVERSSGVTRHLTHAQFSFVDTSVVVVLGHAGTILRSTTLGTSWSQVPSGTTRNLRGISFAEFGNNEAFVVGDSGAVLRSTDGGVAWTVLNSGTTNNLRCVYTLGDIAVVAGEGGTIRRTANGGATWTSVFSGAPTMAFNRFAFSQGPTGGLMWVVGDNGVIYFSSNYGSSWNPQESNTTQNLNDVHFRGMVGAAVGNGGTVRHTTNGGATWIADTYLNTRTTDDILSAFAVLEFISAASGSAVDTVLTGVVLTTSGLNTVSNRTITSVFAFRNIPDNFALLQNYPNPFNPSTEIMYRLPEAGRVTLSVFDLQGRTIATLVDEVQDAGFKSVEWNARDMASGVYLYRLQSGDFVETRKMVLMK